MLGQINKIGLFFLFLPVYCFGQATDPGPGFQMMMMNNPSLAGSEGVGVLRLSYLIARRGRNLSF